jgi:hypothetical protein
MWYPAAMERGYAHSQVPQQKEKPTVAKKRKYHRVKEYTRDNKRIPAHVRRMPCKKK